MFLRIASVTAVLFCLGAVSSGFAQAPGRGGRAGTPPPAGVQRPAQPPRDSRAQPSTGTARIRGRVVAAQTGRPLQRAQVSLGGGGAQGRRVTTDAEGRFEFGDLPAGQFTITAAKTGYVNLQYGQRRPFQPGTPIALAAGQVLDGINLALPPGGVIAVRVTDDLGEPLAGAQVQVQRYQYSSSGQRGLTGVPGMPSPGTTDDRGETRAFGLPPGEFIVSASMRTPPPPTGPSRAVTGPSCRQTGLSRPASPPGPSISRGCCSGSSSRSS